LYLKYIFGAVFKDLCDILGVLICLVGVLNQKIKIHTLPYFSRCRVMPFAPFIENYFLSNLKFAIFKKYSGLMSAIFAFWKCKCKNCIIKNVEDILERVNWWSYYPTSPPNLKLLTACILIKLFSFTKPTKFT
jgi:hypothetical protein